MNRTKNSILTQELGCGSESDGRAARQQATVVAVLEALAVF